jgi:hypothetical protein
VKKVRFVDARADSYRNRRSQGRSFSKKAAFISYRGNTATNKVGSLMLYVSAAQAAAYTTGARLLQCDGKRD